MLTLAMSRWIVTYYNESLVAAIERWPDGIQAKYLRMIDLIEESGPQLGPSHTKAVAPGLYEIRVKAKEGIARSFFCYVEKQEIVVLHCFIKKSQATPKKELEIAKKRLKEIKS